MKDTLDHFLEGNKSLAKHPIRNIEQYATSEEGDPIPLDELHRCRAALEAIITMAQDAAAAVNSKVGEHE